MRPNRTDAKDVLFLSSVTAFMFEKHPGLSTNELLVKLKSGALNLGNKQDFRAGLARVARVG